MRYTTTLAGPNGGGWQQTFDGTLTFSAPLYTEIAATVVSFTNIRDKQLTVRWGGVGNTASTVYVLQRRTGTNAWVTLATNTASTTYTDQSAELLPDTQYEYKVTIKHVSQNTTRDVIVTGSVTTTSDPAVAAAQTAATAALSAKTAAENTLSYSQAAAEAANLAAGNAQTAATNATNAYNQALRLENSFLDTGAGVVQDNTSTVLIEARTAKNVLKDATYGLEAINNSMTTVKTKINSMETQINTIQNTITPVINKVQGINGSTCSATGNFTVIINATGANQYAAYTVGNVPVFVNNNIINVPIIHGVNTINVRAKNATSTAEAESSIVVFGI